MIRKIFSVIVIALFAVGILQPQQGAALTIKQTDIAPLLYGFSIKDGATFEEDELAGNEVIIGMEGVASLSALGGALTALAGCIPCSLIITSLVAVPSFVVLDMVYSIDTNNDSTVTWEDIDGLMSGLMDPQTAELLKLFEKYPDLSDTHPVLAKHAERQRLKAGIDLLPADYDEEANECVIEGGDYTPYARYERRRLSNCKARAYIDGADATEAATKLDYSYAISTNGYPIYIAKYNGTAIEGSGMETVNIDLDNYGLADATVALVSFDLYLEEMGTMVDIGVDLSDVRVSDDHVLSFNLYTWFMDSAFYPYDFSYEVQFAVLGLPEETSIIASYKAIEGNNLIKDTFPLVYDGNIEDIADWLLEDPPSPKLTVLDDIPPVAPGCIQYFPRGFRILSYDSAGVLWADGTEWSGIAINRLQSLVPLPGIDLRLSDSSELDGSPGLMYGLYHREFMGNTSRFVYYYSYPDPSNEDTCLFKEAIQPVGTNAVAFDKPGTITFSQDLLIPKSWSWENADGNDIPYVTLKGEGSGGKLLDILIDNANEVVYGTPSTH